MLERRRLELGEGGAGGPCADLELGRHGIDGGVPRSRCGGQAGELQGQERAGAVTVDELQFDGASVTRGDGVQRQRRVQAFVVEVDHERLRVGVCSGQQQFEFAEICGGVHAGEPDQIEFFGGVGVEHGSGQ